MEKDGEIYDPMIGVDLAKRVFHLHVVSMMDMRKIIKKLMPLQFRRSQLLWLPPVVQEVFDRFCACDRLRASFRPPEFNTSR